MGSIPDGFTRTFHWHNRYCCTMAVRLTQPVREMSTRHVSWGLKAAGAQGWQPYHLHVPTVLKSGSLNLLEPSGPVQACNGIALPFALQLGVQAFYNVMLCRWQFPIFRASSNLLKCCEPLTQWHSITPKKMWILRLSLFFYLQPTQNTATEPQGNFIEEVKILYQSSLRQQYLKLLAAT
jgi:hypothetical protein